MFDKIKELNKFKQAQSKIKKQMEDYISINEGLLGRENSNQIPRYEFIDGKLKKIK